MFRRERVHYEEPVYVERRPSLLGRLVSGVMSLILWTILAVAVVIALLIVLL